MTFLIVLICVVVAVLLLKPAIKKAPAIWYAAAIVLALLYIGVLQGLLPLSAPVRNVLFLLLQKGTLAVALFTVVMFVGVFPRDSKFNSVKARMNSQTWSRVQKWSYVFFGLTYVHVLAMLLPSALSGGMAAVQSVVTYTVVFGAYAVLRIVRAMLDRKRGDLL